MKTVKNLCFLIVLIVSVTACHSNDDKVGNWAKVEAFGGMGRMGAVCFSIGNKAYVGTGINEKAYELKDLWSFDGSQWIQEDTLPAGVKGRYGAVAFSDGEYGYFGLGYAQNESAGASGNKEYFNDFYKYDPNAPRGSRWTKLPDFPGTARRYATGFYVPSPNAGEKGKAFVCFGANYAGSNPVGAMKDWWEYDIKNNRWATEAMVYGDKREGACVGVIGQSAYIFTGADGSTYPTDMIKFSPYADKKFEMLDPLKDIEGRSYDNDYYMIPRGYAVAFVIGKAEDKSAHIYLATGMRGSLLSDCWEFYPFEYEGGRWNEVTSFPTGVLRQAAVGFSMDGLGFVALGGSAHEGASSGVNVPTSTYSFLPWVDDWDQDDY